uniref:AlNc14C352G10922 protein n=1 Tax=Albugo laibachii Nc14 TaxID=890382 RepID=F0WXH1_9STRA|nr:AlNc14C352G10922 [Albugo laibachii Nc14]|eukprot:CCA26164.1 AlNc14C352G10922 [Albugo laibachii Nc14]
MENDFNEDKCDSLAFLLRVHVTVQFANAQCASAVKRIRYTKSRINMRQEKWQPFWSTSTIWRRYKNGCLQIRDSMRVQLENMFVWANSLCELYHCLLVLTLFANWERDEYVLEAKLSTLSLDTLQCVLQSDNLRWDSTSESDLAMRIAEFGKRFMV